MEWISPIVFIILLGITGFLFARQVNIIRHNISMGKKVPNEGPKSERIRQMLLVAFGQQKMFKNFIPAILHLFVYVGFILINIEVLEIIIDGIFGTHRIFAPFIGGSYAAFISFFEILAVAVLLSCVLFIVRRHFLKVKRFTAREMSGWPKLDALIILVVEIVLMGAILLMNAADLQLQEMGAAGYAQTGNYLVSQFIAPIFSGMSESALVVVERTAWWAHIVGIFAFLNYIPYSKHLHIFLAFPNTYYGRLQPKGEMNNMPEITNEVKGMLDLPVDESASDEVPDSFGAKDVDQLSRKNLLDAYSCTECGRCTAACPANITGKLLSPRKIMMDTRDRAEELGRQRLSQKDPKFDDGKSLLGDYITDEELNACTTCNACVEACPVLINPLEIILQLRRYNIMEASKAPNEWNIMFGNIENNQAPWAFPADDRMKWAEEDA